MIKSNDLREGNIHKGEGISIPRLGISPFLVDNTAFAKITTYGIHLVSQGTHTFNPIELNDKWLEYFQFTQTGNNWRKWDTINEEYIVLYKDKLIEMDGYQFIVDNIGVGPVMKYVHDLQNLFYYLTKQEII